MWKTLPFSGLQKIIQFCKLDFNMAAITMMRYTKLMVCVDLQLYKVSQIDYEKQNNVF